MTTEWNPETDAPEAHPMWEEQVRLERDMLKRGADKVRDKAIEAKAKGQMTRLNPLRHLIGDTVPEIAKNMREWARYCEVGSAGGPKPIALPLIKSIDDLNVAGVIALRAILDGFGQEKRGLASLAIRIGENIEHEQRVRFWAKTQPGAFWRLQKDQAAKRSTATHRRRVNIHASNSEVGASWEAWSREQVFRVGLAFIDIIMKTTGWFEIQSDPTFKPRRGVRLTAPLVLAVKAGMTDWLAAAMTSEELSSHDFRPTVMPPKRWTGTRDGGYWTPYLRTPRLVRFKASQEHQKERAADEYDAFDFPKVYEALHVLQETPWKINGRVLDVAIEAWSRKITVETKRGAEPIGKLPHLDDREIPPRHPLLVAHAEETARLREKDPEAKPAPMDEETLREFRIWKRGATQAYDFNARRVSKMRGASATILTAQDYRKYDAIYFPHMLDFRGRIYPIPAYLQPQGADLARGLLTLAEGLPVTADNGGAGWIAIQLASSLGVDKVSFDERIAYVEEREALWRQISADPLSPEVRDVWGTADKPWQSLAAIFEWVAYLDHGEGFVSSLPVMVDGTCNGIQHLSAMTRDAEAGYHVNLIPSDAPKDIYQHVANGLKDTLERIRQAGGEQGDLADYWLGFADPETGKLPRSMTKRQVMVLPYGGSRDAFYKYTRAWLDEADPEPEGGLEDAARELRNKRVGMLTTHLHDEVSAAVVGGVKVMAWLQACAKVVCDYAQPIYWVTPAGYVVRHFYGTLKSIQAVIRLDGEVYKIRRGEFSEKLSSQDQLRGIAPNYIHSLDASALVDCIVLCKERGIASFASVHDAYGTHAANMWPMFSALREAFVKTHEVDNLGNFRWACQRILVAAMVEKGMDELDASDKADRMLPPMLELGDLDLSAVLDSEYFFA